MNPSLTAEQASFQETALRFAREQLAPHYQSREAVAGEMVGLAEVENGCHVVRFCGRDLGLIDRDHRFLRFAPPRARLRVTPETALTQQR